MSYTAPAGNAVNLDFVNGYTAPSGSAVNLEFAEFTNESCQVVSGVLALTGTLLTTSDGVTGTNNSAQVVSGTLGYLGSLLNTDIVEPANIQLSTGNIDYIGGVLQALSTEPDLVEVSSGVVTYTGGFLHTASQNLLGAVAYDPRIQGTDDWYYLSDDLNTYVGTNWLPSVSNIDIGLVGAAFTSNVPVDSHTFSITAGHIASSYLQDFYYRIHLSVYNIQLGNVLSEQTYALSVWSAWFDSHVLSTIGNTNLASVTLDLGITLPKTFAPLEFINGTITVAALGAPTVDGYFDFTFDTEVPRIVIQGQRVVFWPFVPQTTFTETREWLTDVIPTMEGEQRYNLRVLPRATYSYNYMFRSQHEYSVAKSRARTISTLAIATALWTDVVPLTDVSVGTSVLYFDTTYLELDTTTGVLVLWESFETFELVEILSFNATSVTLKNPTLLLHTKCWVAPVKIGYLKNGIEFNRAENHKISSAITIQTTDPYTLAEWPASDTYLTLPVLPEITIASGGLSERMGRETDSFDSETGELIQFDTENYTRFNQTIRLRAHTREQRYKLRRQFDYLQGKYQLFWLPSFNNDLTAVNPVAVATGNDSIKVVYAGWSKYPEQHIKVIGSVTRYFEVIAVTDNLDGTESIQISPAADVDIQSVRSIQVLTKVRLNSDRIEYNHANTNLTLVSAPVIEVV